MLQESNRIILVDDNKEDLKSLSQVFYNKGIGCKAFEYDSDFPTPLMGVRIAFFDVNLNSGLNEKQMFSTLIDALNLYIHRDNDPYILVFWTSDTSLVPRFKDFVNRSENGRPANPYYVTNIDKTEVTNGTSYEVLINRLFSNQSVKVLFEYEELMDKSIHKTVTDIIATIPSSEQWGDTTGFEENLNKVFASIALQSAGICAKDNPDKAIKEALLPLCLYSFVNIKQTLWKDFLDFKKTSFPNKYQTSQLNNIFNLDFESNIKHSDRGVVSLFPLEKFEDVFQIKDEEWIKKTFPLTDKSKEISDYIDIMCVEFSAACDYSWNKKRTNKYLLGMIVPVDIVPLLDKNNTGDYFYIHEYQFNINGKDCMLIFNFNYTFTLSTSSKVALSPIFRIKKEMMDMIGNRYANHVSRIGITSFR